jgi:hypothetical protein
MVNRFPIGRTQWPRESTADCVLPPLAMDRPWFESHGNVKQPQIYRLPLPWFVQDRPSAYILPVAAELTVLFDRTIGTSSGAPRGSTRW